ncbi:MAG: isocitrate lyase, partial [Psychrosphaera sp.]|nr:isocitrate lyase [Psychrosphaera sp.]
LTQKIPVSQTAGDLAEQYNAFIDGNEVTSIDELQSGDLVLRQTDKLIKPTRLANGLIRFKPNTGEDRVVLDCIASLQHGADLLWIETEKPHVGQIANMVNRIREVVPNAKLVYNNSPSFNWTLNFRQQTFDIWAEQGKDMTEYHRDNLMSAQYDESALAIEADQKIQSFQRDSAKQAGIFHHLITLPTYHTAALSTDNLAKDYYGEQGMLAYVKGVQRQEIRQNLACVKHQDMSGSNIGDEHKGYFSGEQALKAGGKDNTMNQFS